MCFVLFLTKNCLDKWDHHSFLMGMAFAYYGITSILDHVSSTASTVFSVIFVVGLIIVAAVIYCRELAIKNAIQKEEKEITTQKYQ